MEWGGWAWHICWKKVSYAIKIKRFLADFFRAAFQVGFVFYWVIFLRRKYHGIHHYQTMRDRICWNLFHPPNKQVQDEVSQKNNKWTHRTTRATMGFIAGSVQEKQFPIFSASCGSNFYIKAQNWPRQSLGEIRSVRVNKEMMKGMRWHKKREVSTRVLSMGSFV